MESESVTETVTGAIASPYATDCDDGSALTAGAPPTVSVKEAEAVPNVASVTVIVMVAVPAWLAIGVSVTLAVVAVCAENVMLALGMSVGFDEVPDSVRPVPVKLMAKVVESPWLITRSVIGAMVGPVVTVNVVPEEVPPSPFVNVSVRAPVAAPGATVMLSEMWVASVNVRRVHGHAGVRRPLPRASGPVVNSVPVTMTVCAVAPCRSAFGAERA